MKPLHRHMSTTKESNWDCSPEQSPGSLEHEVALGVMAKTEARTC